MIDPHELLRHIRDIPDHPQPGVMFRDITPLLADAGAFSAAIDALAAPYLGEVDLVAGVEARGFMFAAPVAHRLGVGFVPVRKPGKLPWDTVTEHYELEYGTDALEIHTDATVPGQRILLVDDVLATGGTAAAAVALLSSTGATVVAAAFLIELLFLSGHERLGDVPIHSLLTYS
ncbi:MAG: adenine phosphoribosyltransferase [Acidimicrobiales bacterium]